MRFLLIFWLMSALKISAQTPSQGPVLHAFFSIQHRGNIPVDEQGNPLMNGVDTVYSLVAEFSLSDTAGLRFQEIWVGRYRMVPISTGVYTGKMVLGYDYETRQEISMKPRPGYCLMAFALRDATPAPKNGALPSGGMLITGKSKGKRTQWKVMKMKALPSVFYP